MDLNAKPQQNGEGHDQVSVRDAVLQAEPVNPALQRLQARILKSSDASEVITSYDRMHHRHNRS